MAELESTKGHCHPRFDVCRQKDESTILDDYLEVGIQELEDEIEVCFRGEYIHELAVGIQRCMKGDRRRERVTSMMFWWCSSRRYLTSRMADMSRPSLNCPTFIFLMATFLEVDASRPVDAVQLGVRKNARRRRTPIHNCVGTFTDFLVLDPVVRRRRSRYEHEQTRATIFSDVPRWPFRQHPCIL